MEKKVGRGREGGRAGWEVETGGRDVEGNVKQERAVHWHCMQDGGPGAALPDVCDDLSDGRIGGGGGGGGREMR